MDLGNIHIAIILTILAGLSTGLGGLFVLYSKKVNKKFMAIVLGFSAGVMIYVSMVEMLSISNSALSKIYQAKLGNLISITSFFAGIILIALIDKILPEANNPHDLVTDDKRLMRIGVFTAIAIAIHNFPEGLSTFVSSMQSPSLALPIVFAIALHNIPEGISVALPIYYATKSRKKAFFYSLASGMFEPLGAIAGYLLLMPFLNDTMMGIIFGIVAGIMVYISLDELLPSAREYGEHHLSIYGLISGMAVMAISIWAFY